ncbi:MAG: hypothetical protein AB1478_06975 [Nitrospirota bacterium]
MEEQSKQEKKEKINIKGDIINHFSKIKSLSDSGVSLMNKVEEFDENDISKAFDITDEIQEECEEIVGLLFELRES